jgi:hypothetical protein
MEQQAAIAALRHGLSEPHEPDRAITQVVGLPAAVGHAASSEQRFSDLPVTRLLAPPVKRSQREREAVAPGGGKHGRVTPQGAADQAAPEPEGGDGANHEQGIERQDSAKDRVAGLFQHVQPEQRALPFDQPFGAVFGDGRSKRYDVTSQVRDGQISREGSYRDRARQRSRGPQDAARASIGVAHCEIVPPSAARNVSVRRR